MELEELQETIRPIAHWLDIKLELPLFYELVTGIPAGGIYLEVGTFMGCSAIAAALCADPGVEIHTIDNGATAAGKGTSSKKYCDRLYYFFDRFKVTHRINFYLCDSDQMVWDKEHWIDVLYIDGAHDVKSVTADVQKWEPFVRPGGHAIFHDATTHKAVKKAIDETIRTYPDWVEEEPASSVCHFMRLT